MESRSSLIKFSPQFLIAPGRMVRMMSMGTKPADMRIDLAMGVPLEFLASEMWFCTNCCKNSLFQMVLEEVRNLPILIEYDDHGAVVPCNWGMSSTIHKKRRSGRSRQR